MRSFKKTADSISIGTNPGRYYLSPELIAQLPGYNTPLFFPNDALPTLPGKTTAFGRDNGVHTLRLETTPGSLEPDIGDVRAMLTLTDYLSRDSNRQISIVAKQAPYVHGQAHRTLAPWDSNLTSWKDGSRLIVDWLNLEPSTLDDMVSEHRTEALDGVWNTILHLRVWSVLCILIGMWLLCGPLVKTWLSRREWITDVHKYRDVMMLVVILLALSLSYALVIISLPWLHYWHLCGGLLLGGSFLSCIVAICTLSFLDTRANLVEVLVEHKIFKPSPVTVDTAKDSQLPLANQGANDDYGAVGDASSAGMADVEEGQVEEAEESEVDF